MTKELGLEVVPKNGNTDLLGMTLKKNIKLENARP